MDITLHNKTYTNCQLIFGKYANNQNALQIFQDGQPLIKASVCIPEVLIHSDQILIKDWSENEGILEQLIAAGIVKHTGYVVPTGFTYADKCDLITQPE